MKGNLAVAAIVGAVVILWGVCGFAQVFQGLPAPYNAAPTAIEDQQQYQPQSQRISPSNRLYLGPVGQPQRYDATTINRYLMGGPGSDYRVRPVVRQPMYQSPGQ